MLSVLIVIFDVRQEICLKIVGSIKSLNIILDIISLASQMY